ncbi:dTDP-4-dehydrorhamnose 3,5-epimerase family protein [Mucilaginibacter gossypii]|uniref:dTDP-4-dehydrorhamnose 3,5-epimerase family protein n=1 Tax=Mucilaginibacter gossypii TaxID=551996 RepID=UPI000DCF484D|nr:MULTISPECIES: dTDP-4-dehydrorhamnose 3,5-epimerase family protein [Mucilaginibacter]QTE40258.1 dTDP-4-dehydrorhamnose 3,5-epimerase family protein [Mucilaginibacter gossypii]RAV57541.1 dTDP-4-dehydrorhamnose 3,5-epimerase [Mucilaginibacter rubeus]
MELEQTIIEDLKILHLKKLDDSRGSFTKIFNVDFFEANNLRTDFKESYFSVSHKNVIRGMHYQSPPTEHTKLVFVNTGRIVDVVLDIRTGSKTYGQYFYTTVSVSQPKLIYIPVGCAHGFLSLEDNTIVSYIQTSVYNNSCDHGVKWDSFGMEWPVTDPIVSVRDMAFDGLNDIKSPFV